MRNRLDKANIDSAVVSGFGYEWQRFDQRALEEGERQQIFHDYFRIFPWETLTSTSVGADIGCGSGRWAKVAAPLVGTLHLVDASEEALSVAYASLSLMGNVCFHQASVSLMPFEDISLDFAYSLGVLHHVPDTVAALREVARILKPGAPFLLYLYYAFDNRPLWYRITWKVSDIIRKVVAHFPNPLRHLLSEVFAASIYWPLARIALWLERRGRLPASWPLAYYRDKSFYTMRTDALDRFGTALEKRFTREQIQIMLKSAGFIRVRFSDRPPFWCAVAEKS